MAPQLLVGTAVDTAAHLSRRRRDVPGLVLAGFSLVGLGWLVAGSRRSRNELDAALVEGLGVDYAAELDAQPTPAELATPWRRFVNPFRAPRRDVCRCERDIAYADEHGSAGCSTSTARQGEGLDRRPGPAAGARRRLDDRRQGPARASR